jgi:ABC-type nitrate/sulfonate/bicarbonate transport system ATPase subunit
MPGSISARGVTKTFPTEGGGRLNVIDGVDLDVAEGEFVALVGPSGCGKSTFLDILAGFEKPDAGSVTVDGASVEGPSRRRILLPQQPSVFPWLTVRRNITFMLDGISVEEKRKRTMHYLGIVGLHGFEMAFPYQLSGGMLKRLEIARALIVKPDILLMDEPFGPLDALTRIKIHTELRQILRVEKHTCLLVTHDVHEAIFLADRIAVMTPRPARIQTIIKVDYPHPRALVGGEITRLKAQVLEALGVAPDGSDQLKATPALAGGGEQSASG